MTAMLGRSYPVAEVCITHASHRFGGAFSHLTLQEGWHCGQ
ncbi:hypothetical protein SAMN05661093_09049 [Kibdelosporangium aridum]|uniref:Uncharacterized protein n=1 Tax=Kibdelosporangium aridum TaxID=2030 RepID=A0A1W2FTL9_KIBAR|nr:hypothetical protein SAMN05661093_09049 [Kibdelosporangium aridum]